MPKRKQRTRATATWENARKLYLKYPLLSLSDIASILGVSRQAINEFVNDLKEQHEELRTRELERIKRELPR